MNLKAVSTDFKLAGAEPPVNHFSGYKQAVLFRVFESFCLNRFGFRESHFRLWFLAYGSIELLKVCHTNDFSIGTIPQHIEYLRIDCVGVHPDRVIHENSIDSAGVRCAKGEAKFTARGRFTIGKNRVHRRSHEIEIPTVGPTSIIPLRRLPLRVQAIVFAGPQSFFGHNKRLAGTIFDVAHADCLRETNVQTIGKIGEWRNEINTLDDAREFDVSDAINARRNRPRPATLDASPKTGLRAEASAGAFVQGPETAESQKPVGRPF